MALISDSLHQDRTVHTEQSDLGSPVPDMLLDIPRENYPESQYCFPIPLI